MESELKTTLNEISVKINNVEASLNRIELLLSIIEPDIQFECNMESDMLFDAIKTSKPRGY